MDSFTADSTDDTDAAEGPMHFANEYEAEAFFDRLRAVRDPLPGETECPQCEHEGCGETDDGRLVTCDECDGTGCVPADYAVRVLCGWRQQEEAFPLMWVAIGSAMATAARVPAESEAAL